jgi:HlyD family secretion protein
METGNKENILCIKESLLQFNRITDKPFVEIQEEDGVYKKSNVKIGISDGINVEILEGVTENDEIKVWNIVTDEDEEVSQEDTQEEVED